MDRCPFAYAGHEAADAIRAADLAEKGLLPEPGGWLDQAAIGIRAIERVWREQDHAEAKQIAEAARG